MHEREWIAQLQAGNVAAFRAIFEAYTMKLYRFAAIWVPGDVAEDIVQDVLFDIWRRRKEIQLSPDNLGGYLFSAVRKKTLTHRRHQRVTDRAADHVTHANDTLNYAVAAHPTVPDEQVTADELRRAVTSAMMTLSDLQRAALFLRWNHGMEYSEIATVLSITEIAARHHVSRARKNLRPVLERHLGLME